MALHEKTPIEQRILSVLVENQPGVLAHVVGLFSARGFNIDSLAVGETEDPTVSRMTIVVAVDEKIFEQIKKQLNKLIVTIKVQDLTAEDFADRELMLVKIKNTETAKEKLKELSNQYRLFTIDENPKTITLESAETRENTKKLFELFKQTGILEIARTGTVALSKKPPKDEF